MVLVRCARCSPSQCWFGIVLSQFNTASVQPQIACHVFYIDEEEEEEKNNKYTQYKQLQ